MKTSKAKGGFTLVELLVVIGIIAVLISMLLPALNRARQQARLVECSARLRELITASHAYAADNKGTLPPPRSDNGQWDYDYQSHFRNINEWPGDTVPGREIGANIGRLIARKYLNDERMTQCPLALSSGEVDRAFDQNYCYNVHVKKVTQNGTSRHKVWWPKVSGFGKTPHGPVLVSSGIADRTLIIPRMDRALASDQMGRADFGARAITHVHGQWKYYNLAFIDGSVRSAKMRTNITRDPQNNWPRFLDMLGMCEAIINGTASGPPNNQYNLYVHEKK